MSFHAVSGAHPAVSRFVLVLNRHLATKFVKYPPTGQGVARAKARLAAKRKANKSIPNLGMAALSRPK